ncbi:MAG TPA: hypothetical protein VGR53_11280 [Nitrososphaerales archaeon]|nr:hypothetical protein [Nitrososphaerales archaeon]
MGKTVTSRRQALGTAFVAIVAVLLIVAASGLYLLVSTRMTSSSTTYSTSKTTSTTSQPSTGQQSGSSAVYQTIERNLTLRGQAAVVPCVGFNEANCPSAPNATLHPVDLITYGGTYYYLYNKTEETQCCGVFSNATTTITIAPTFSTYATWFTNSSVFCISPAHPITNTEHQNRTCPNEPYHTNSFDIQIPSTSALSSTTGLRLDLSLSINSSGGIIVIVDEFNTLARVNNLSASAHWPLNPSGLFLWLQGSCGPPNFPVGYAILQGNYSASSFKTGVPLTLEAQPLTTCPYEAPTPYFAFRPLSDVALTYQWANIASLAGVYNVTVNTSCHWTPGSGCFTGGTGTWSGYWTGSGSQRGAGIEIDGGACPGQSSSHSCPLLFDDFPSGTYTVVAADEWGQVVLLHFKVTGGTSAMTTTTSTTLISQCPTGTVPMTVNGSDYCASDVSKDIVVQQPGYSYLLNSSITFMGVKFETICPSNYSGCPGTNGSSMTVTAAAIQFNMTFPDGTREAAGGVIGDSTYFFALSNHRNPRGGILIEYISGTYSYKAFLLVSPSK